MKRPRLKRIKFTSQSQNSIKASPQTSQIKKKKTKTRI